MHVDCCAIPWQSSSDLGDKLQLLFRIELPRRFRLRRCSPACMKASLRADLANAVPKLEKLLQRKTFIPPGRTQEIQFDRCLDGWGESVKTSIRLSFRRAARSSSIRLHPRFWRSTEVLTLFTRIFRRCAPFLHLIWSAYYKTYYVMELFYRTCCDSSGTFVLKLIFLTQ